VDLQALELFNEDRHYVLIGDTVVIVDAASGRLQHGMRWQHQVCHRHL
jgi:preprotein translocase subunit SecA